MPETVAHQLLERVRRSIRDVPDFPKPGIIFKDITPLLADALLFGEVVEHMAAVHAGAGIERVVGIESRGFLFAAPLALRLGCGLVPVRKPGKLPYRTQRVDYALEYGADSLEAHEDAVRPGQRVLVVDDVLATGGTAEATIRLVRCLGGEVAGAIFLVELEFLQGRARFADLPVHSLVQY